MSRDFESLPSGENAGVPKDWFAEKGVIGHLDFNRDSVQDIYISR